MRRSRRPGLVIATTTLLCLFGAPLAAASAAATHPARAVQPAAPTKSGPFKIGPSTSAGTVAVEPDGTFVLVWDDNQAIVVCTITPGERKCATKTDLHSLDGDGLYDTPQVFVSSANHVAVLQNTCCDSSPNGGDLLFSSTDGGKEFSAPVRVGSLDVDAAALVSGSQIAFTAADTSTWQVESIPLSTAGPPPATASLPGKGVYEVSDSDYKGGALVGSDYLGSRYTTYVDFASSGANFNSGSSYHRVGKFPGEQLIGTSGSALLTVQTAKKQSVLLRLFNGRGFGPAHVVPHSSGGGPEVFTVCQAPDGHVYVFFGRAAYRTYDLIEESTSNGSKWSKAVGLGNAVDSDLLTGVVRNSGHGLILGTNPAIGYPVG
jgi:hypothetical protein